MPKIAGGRVEDEKGTFPKRKPYMSGCLVGVHLSLWLLPGTVLAMRLRGVPCENRTFLVAYWCRQPEPPVLPCLELPGTMLARRKVLHLKKIHFWLPNWGVPKPPPVTYTPSNIHRKSIESLSNIYRKSIENLSKSVEHLSEIY